MDAPKPELTEYTAKEVAAHQHAGDLWVIIHGQVFDVSKYIHDHPGGADVFAEIAGADGSEAFDNAQHSEDALYIKDGLLVGRLKEDQQVRKRTSKTVRLIAPAASSNPGKGRLQGLVQAITTTSLGLVACVGIWWITKQLKDTIPPFRSLFTTGWLSGQREGLGFAEGILFASAIFSLTVGMAVRRFMTTMSLWTGQWRYEAHAKIPRIAQPEVLSQRGWLDPGVFQKLPLARKELLAPNTYRFVFDLPKPDAVLGLPTGQHVSIRGVVDGKAISRSYTPISNNADTGTLELVVRCYNQGIFTSGYLRHLEIGDEVEFRGPKGGIRYSRGMCQRIGMIAGGTGITPMYQLIRAICEDQRDTTEVSLIYANRTEQDILLREELDSFARRYPDNFKVYYVLDQAPVAWQGGTGFVKEGMIRERLAAPSPRTKVFVCGPPPMVESVKKSLGTLRFQAPGAIARASDEVLCF